MMFFFSHKTSSGERNDTCINQGPDVRKIYTTKQAVPSPSVKCLGVPLRQLRNIIKQMDFKHVQYFVNFLR